MHSGMPSPRMGLHCLKQCFAGFCGSKSIRMNTTTQVLTRGHFTLDMISVNRSTSQWFQHRLVYVFDWFHVNLLNLNIFRQLIARFMDFITLHLTTVSVPWLLHWFYNFCILHSYLINHQNSVCINIMSVVIYKTLVYTIVSNLWPLAL